jgi:hypothetical protein
MYSRARNMAFLAFWSLCAKSAPCASSRMYIFFLAGPGEIPSSLSGEGIEHLSKRFYIRNSSSLAPALLNSVVLAILCTLKSLLCLRSCASATALHPRPPTSTLTICATAVNRRAKEDRFPTSKRRVLLEMLGAQRRFYQGRRPGGYQHQILVSGQSARG